VAQQLVCRHEANSSCGVGGVAAPRGSTAARRVRAAAAPLAQYTASVPAMGCRQMGQPPPRARTRAAQGAHTHLWTEEP
jgi:hypothetical protein